MGKIGNVSATIALEEAISQVEQELGMELPIEIYSMILDELDM